MNGDELVKVIDMGIKAYTEQLKTPTRMRINLKTLDKIEPFLDLVGPHHFTFRGMEIMIDERMPDDIVELNIGGFAQ